MHRHEDVARRRVVDRVARLTSERDARHQHVGASVNNGIGLAVFIRHKDSPWTRRVGEAVRVGDRTHSCECRESLHVHHCDLVVSRRRGIDTTQVSHCPNAVNPVEAVQVRDHPPRARVEDHELVGVHVGDVEPPARRVETLIVEPHRIPGQGHVGDDPQGWRPGRGHRIRQGRGQHGCNERVDRQ
jgi:hypothetical protein